MHPRRSLPIWSAFVLVFAAQCGDDVNTGATGGSQPPGASNPGPTNPPPGMQPPAMPPGVTPPGMPNPPPSTPPTNPPTNPPPGMQPPPVTPPPAPPGGPTPTPAQPPGPWARNVQIGLIEAAQGVFVKLGADGQAVPAAMRNAPLVEGRPMFTRVHVTTANGFTARQLRAVLSLSYMDGTKYEIEETKMISGASNVQMLNSTFNFLVPAVQVKPNTSFAAAVYETGAGMGPDPMNLPRFPGNGMPADLAVKAGRMEITVVVVPEPGLADSPMARKRIEQEFFDFYPVQKVNLKFHEPVPFDGMFASGKVFTVLRDLRTKEMAKPWEYYHYLTKGPAGFAGVSSGAGASINDASRRTSITIVRGMALDGNPNTMVHETGHANGVSHMPGCGAAGPDNMYPYQGMGMPAGDMGVNGYSLSFNAFKSRMMFRELMSYCRPRWVSDYVWKKFETRVRIITGFENMGAAAMTQMMASHSLLGYAGPGQDTADYGIVNGSLVDTTATLTPTTYARLRLVDGREVMAPVSVNLLTDDETREFAVNLDGADYAVGDILQAQVVIDGKPAMVPVGSMFRL